MRPSRGDDKGRMLNFRQGRAVENPTPYWQKRVCWLHVPCVQVLPAQQRLPGVPHWTHAFWLQTSVLEPHVSFAQHA